MSASPTCLVWLVFGLYNNGIILYSFLELDISTHHRHEDSARLPPADVGPPFSLL